MLSRTSLATLTAIALLAAACSAPGDAADSSSQDLESNAAPAPAPAATMPDNLHWFRNSAERRAAYLQSFRLATMNVDAALAAYDAPEAGAWAVITDADETILDNSQYQKERGAQGWSADSWSAWVQSKQSSATPGSVAYVKHVHDLGGHVFVVTNGAQADCPAYTSHIQELGFQVDGVLCQTDTSDKNPRFASIESTHRVLVWTGDNINDFPNQSQASRTDDAKLAEFGSRFVVLPNPMYGSWTSNPRN